MTQNLETVHETLMMPVETKPVLIQSPIQTIDPLPDDVKYDEEFIFKNSMSTKVEYTVV